MCACLHRMCLLIIIADLSSQLSTFDLRSHVGSDNDTSVTDTEC